MKKLTSLLLSIIIVLLLCPVTDLIAQGTSNERLIDEANILSDSEEKVLLSLLDEISERQDCDVAILTTNTLPEGYYDVGSFADDFYISYDLGMGNGNDGILLVLIMNSRDWCITTNGFGSTAINDAGLDYISEKFLPYFGDDKYNEGFTTYAELCDQFLTQAKTGTSYDADHLPKETNWFIWIGGSLIFGVLVALIATSIMKGQMKSVAFQRAASSYLREGSMNVAQSRDTFMYSKVTRTARPKQTKTTTTASNTMQKSPANNSHHKAGGKF